MFSENLYNYNLLSVKIIVKHSSIPKYIKDFDCCVESIMSNTNECEHINLRINKMK